MKNNSNQERKISRRGILPILGGSLLLPFLGFGNTVIDETSNPEDEEYQTLLKPDGTTVKVKVSAIKKAKIVKKNVSNKSFLNWLGKKL
jgi:hypothetical protein